LVLVVKLTAVLKVRSAGTPENPIGLSGSLSCRRRIKYVKTKLTTETISTDTVY
jgi:hypothetical protein